MNIALPLIAFAVGSAITWIIVRANQICREIAREESAPERDACISSKPGLEIFESVCPACHRATDKLTKERIQGAATVTDVMIDWGVKAKVCAECKAEQAAAKFRQLPRVNGKRIGRFL
jgi:cytochrome c5